MKKLIFCILFTVFITVPLISQAEPSVDNALLEFLRPLSAQVVMPLDDGILIDKGAADHIAPRDIFSIVLEEKNLIHPETGEIIDVLRSYGSLFEVVRVKQNLAYCKALNDSPQPASGTSVRRFENLPIFFEDLSGSGFQVFTRLREKLPHLQWQDYLNENKKVLQSDTPALLVRYVENRLKVINQNQQILFVGQVRKAVTSAPTEAVLPAVARATLSLNRQQDSVVTARNLVRVKLPENLEIQALNIYDVDRDGKAETILGFRSGLMIGHLTDGIFQELSRITAEKNQQIIDINIINLDNNKLPEIIVSSLVENDVVSTIYRYAKEDLSKIADSRLLLGLFSDKNGQEILIGMDQSELLKRQPKLYRIQLEGDRITKTSFKIPAARQVYGIARLSDDQGQSYLVQLSESSQLKVTDTQGKNLWTSGDFYGGATANIKIPQPGARNVGSEDKLFLQSTLQLTPRQTLLTTKHSGARFFKNSPSHKNGRIVELRWNGFSLDEIGISENMGGLIADFDQTDLDNDGDSDLIAAIVYTSGNLFSKAVSGLVIIPNERQ